MRDEFSELDLAGGLELLAVNRSSALFVQDVELLREAARRLLLLRDLLARAQPAERVVVIEER